MSQKSLNLTALLTLTFLLLNLSCCDDCKCPTCPKKPVPGSYYVYISDLSQDPPGYIWVADSKTDSVIDSILTPDPDITLMDISPDKSHLAALAISLDSVFIFDLETRDKIIGLPAGFPYFTPDGAYLLIADGIRMETLYKISTSDWSIIDTDTMVFLPYGIFNNVPILYGRDSTAKEYFLYDYASMEIIKIDSLQRPDGSTPQFLDIIASPDDRYFYFTSRPNKIFKFEIETDSIVDSLHIIYGAYHGQLKNSPDGKYILLTEVTEWWTDYPLGNLLIIDRDSFSIYRRISTWNLNQDFPGGALAPALFDITPDGFKVICGNNMAAMPPVSFNLVDLCASIVEGFGNQADICDVAVGKQIE